MKKFKWHLKILSLVIVISALLAVIPMPQAEEYSVPTLYIDNRAWYMYSLFPITEQDGAYLVPSSFFGGVDGVEISFDNVRSCLLLQHGESFISVNVKTHNALLHTGEVVSTAVSLINDEYFVDSELCARALGFSVEVAEYYEKTVLRLRTFDDLIDFKTLIERNRISESTLPIQTDKSEAKADRKDKTLSFVADFTKMSADEQSLFTDFLVEKNLSVTVVIDKNNLTDPKMLKCLSTVNAQCGSFIIRGKSTSQISECNDLLWHLFRNKTRLVTGPDALKIPAEAIGYIFKENCDAGVSADPKKIDMKTLTTVEITNFTNNSASHVIKWTNAAEENGVYIAPLNQRTGN